MKKHFYSHIIEIETIYSLLNVMDLEENERHELIIIIDSTIHHTIIDTILSELSEKDKKIFLSYMQEEKHDDLWSLLKSKVDRVEHKINHIKATTATAISAFIFRDLLISQSFIYKSL